MATAMIPTWTLGDRLAKARRAARVSTAEMAAYLACDRKTVGNYEAGRTHAPRAVVLAYHMRTQVPLEWIEHGDDGPDRPSEQGEVTSGCTVHELVAA